MYNMNMCDMLAINTTSYNDIKLQITNPCN